MDDDQQFCLRWNNHQSTLVSVFDNLLENGTLVDCTLFAEGKYLKAHKVVLSACSPYFEALLTQQYDKHPIFILKDVKFQELKAMMDYMYRGEVNISQDQLAALLKAAESLQIKGLSDSRSKEAEPRKSAPPPAAKTPPPAPAPTLPRVQGLTIEQRKAPKLAETLDDSRSREGSTSPVPRKRKKPRRRPSQEGVNDNHDASSSSESHSNQAPANIPSLPAVPLASTSKLTDVPEPADTKKPTATADSPQVPIKEKQEIHSELILEPKSEYIEEEMNEDSVEDLTLDDDDVSQMEHEMDHARPGPSHGAADGSTQGFGGWHMSGNQTQDEVFLAAQEAVGAHRDSQEITNKGKSQGKRRREDDVDKNELEKSLKRILQQVRIIVPAKKYKKPSELIVTQIEKSKSVDIIDLTPRSAEENFSKPSSATSKEKPKQPEDKEEIRPGVQKRLVSKANCLSLKLLENPREKESQSTNVFPKKSSKLITTQMEKSKSSEYIIDLTQSPTEENFSKPSSAASKEKPKIPEETEEIRPEVRKYSISKGTCLPSKLLEKPRKKESQSSQTENFPVFAKTSSVSDKEDREKETPKLHEEKEEIGSEVSRHLISKGTCLSLKLLEKPREKESQSTQTENLHVFAKTSSVSDKEDREKETPKLPEEKEEIRPEVRKHLISKGTCLPTKLLGKPHEKESTQIEHLHVFAKTSSISDKEDREKETPKLPEQKEEIRPEVSRHLISKGTCLSLKLLENPREKESQSTEIENLHVFAKTSSVCDKEDLEESGTKILEKGTTKQVPKEATSSVATPPTKIPEEEVAKPSTSKILEQDENMTSEKISVSDFRPPTSKLLEEESKKLPKELFVSLVRLSTSKYFEEQRRKKSSHQTLVSTLKPSTSKISEKGQTSVGKLSSLVALDKEKPSKAEETLTSTTDQSSSKVTKRKSSKEFAKPTSKALQKDKMKVTKSVDKNQTEESHKMPERKPNYTNIRTYSRRQKLQKIVETETSVTESSVEKQDPSETTEKKFTCLVCHVTFNRENNLQWHQKLTQHNNNMP